MKDNIRINKMQTVVKPICGDVKEVANDLPKFDRIVMPLPKGGEDFLGKAFERAVENAVIHFYTFGKRDFPYADSEKRIIEQAKNKNKEISIISKKIVRPFSPSVVQVVFDILVKN